jgi:IS30 family transposase
MRFRWYLQVEKHGKTIDEVCRIFGMSKKTYHKWYRKDHGYGPSAYRPRRTHPQAKIVGRVEREIVETKTLYNYGPEKMRIHLRKTLSVDVSTTALYKFFRKKRLIRKPQKRLAWYRPMKRRLKARRPGQNVQLDVKYVPSPEGGWGYQYRFIDALTRWQFAVETFDRSAESSIRALHLAERSFPFALAGIQTDNGGEFRGDFARHLETRGITHRFIPKRSAPWNGKVERANRSVDDEYYLNPTRPWATLSSYVNWYNKKRLHLGKGMHGMTPQERLTQYLERRRKQSPLKVN